MFSIFCVVNIKHVYVGGCQNPVTVNSPFIVVKGTLNNPFILVVQCLNRAQCVRVCLQKLDVAGVCFYRPRCWGGLAAQSIEGSDRAVKMCRLLCVLLCCRHSWHYRVCVCVMSVHGNQRTSHCFYFTSYHFLISYRFIRRWSSCRQDVGFVTSTWVFLVHCVGIAFHHMPLPWPEKYVLYV